MREVGDRKNSWIAKDRAGRPEGYLVLAQVRVCLGIILLELKLQFIHNSLSHTMLRWASDATVPCGNRETLEED